MARTRTGGFPVGFRRTGGWSKDLEQVASVYRDTGMQAYDAAHYTLDELRALTAAGVALGTVDLLDWPALLSADEGRQRDAVARNAQWVRDVAALGTSLFFMVLLPEDPAAKRAENFKLAVRGLERLRDALGPLRAKVVLEGWPGPGALACNPETYRAVLEACPIAAVNFDPSHLVRMRIDVMRFVREFAPRIAHVHAKDTEVYPDALYEVGSEQPATFVTPHRWGTAWWRYTVPGQGVTPWSQVLAVLRDAGYAGKVCIELEDENYSGTLEGEKRGLLDAARFLSTA